MRIRSKIIFASIALAAVFTSCRKDEIDAYKAEDCAVNFHSRTNGFSLRGMKDDTMDLTIVMDIVGPSVDYDRTISVNIEDSTAVQGRDFELISATIPAGELHGSIVIRVNRLAEGQTGLSCKMSIVPNEYFREGYPDYQSTVVSWTELYARPTQEVWRSWFLFFSPYYSQNLHKILIEVFGEDVENYTNFTPKVEGQIRKMPTWWYSASRELRSYVKAHDDANPDSPYRHSADCEYYKSYNVAVGEGTKPETLPTIYETLNVF